MLLVIFLIIYIPNSCNLSRHSSDLKTLTPVKENICHFNSSFTVVKEKVVYESGATNFLVIVASVLHCLLTCPRFIQPSDMGAKLQ
jgi:hypothetical protein